MYRVSNQEQPVVTSKQPGATGSNKENQVIFGLESLNQSLKDHYNENVAKNDTKIKHCTKKMKFSIKYFCSKCDQICRKL